MFSKHTDLKCCSSYLLHYSYIHNVCFHISPFERVWGGVGGWGEGVSHTYHIVCGCLYSSEEQEQSQGKGNAQVEVNKIMEFQNQLFSESEKLQTKGAS